MDKYKKVVMSGYFNVKTVDDVKNIEKKFPHYTGAEIRDGKTAMMVAAEKGLYEIVEAFIERQFPTNGAIHLAAKNGYANIVDLLIRSGVDVNEPDDRRQSALMYATSEGWVDVVDVLLYYGAKIQYDFRSALALACENGRTDVINILLQRDDCDVNYKKDPPILAAVRYGDTQIIDRLIIKAVNLDIRTDFETPLTVAIKTKNISMIEYLIKYGANVNNETKFGDSIIHLAILAIDGKNNYSTEIPDLLMANGADINYQNQDGETCFFWYMKHYFNTEMWNRQFRYLLGHRPDPRIKNNKGVSPLTPLRNGTHPSDDAYNYVNTFFPGALDEE